ncbi:Ribulose-1,5 bisphosphate carboxylase/oxygenase large subunit N-methyltransferase, chloroplastic [Sesamum angolense]|uniref:Ribulose-1,5 bisphosphate carboxylase/oxygenase large subunit N-methyltransferase, chloroplastic n=1 Tax=Sesamum angolense TaxID=2727404 RepID=A0AAE1X0V2_9LAMI|nr:Ribulose-1,5 bisphosphate carboxylase/oxygenase large subunit N-methyltransferase, chloroplastic [Sesamum angolense]
MASLFAVQPPTPSSILKTPGRNDFLKTNPTLHHFKKRSFSLNSVLSTQTDPNIPQTVQRFWQWLKDEGVVSSKTPVKPGIVPEGLGLVATRNIGRNEVVLEVPKRFWINQDAAAASEIGSICSGLKPFISVALFLLSEKFKGEESKWKYYIDVLPESTSSTIYCAGQKRSFLRFRINHSAKVTTEDHAHEVRGPAGLFSWDYLFQLRSPLSLKAGEQVFIQYDIKKSNADMALDYGFIESNSDRDAFTLTLEISESDEFFADKLDIAESNGFGETAYFDIKYGQPLPTAMLPYLRLVALGGSDAFLLESIFRNSIWGFLELPISRANEELICKVVRSACKSALSGYHTTIEEDEKLKEEGNLSPRLEIAVGIRIGEKKVLQQIDDIFRERESELDLLEYYQERRLKDLGLVGEQEAINGRRPHLTRRVDKVDILLFPQSLFSILPNPSLCLLQWRRFFQSTTPPNTI